MKKEVKRNIGDDFEIDGDYGIFMKIVEDMGANAGILKPAINWGVEIKNHSGSDYFGGAEVGSYAEIKEAYNKKYSTMRKMMDPWIGCVGLQSITQEIIGDYADFIRLIDDLDLSPQYFDKSNKLTEKGRGLLNTDLGTIIDLNLINKFSAKENISIIEVGGGYGRLTEGFFEAIGGGKVKYLMLDSVPASLLYSCKYLRKKFPELKIGFYYDGDDLDFDVYDCYIMPTWHYTPTDYKFDVCLNIQSMQEMAQHHVDYFLDLFDKSVASDGIVYLSNEKDYVFQGAWNYPSRWNLVLSIRTPRSWTRNSPTEIYSIEPRRDQYESAMRLTYEMQLIQYDKTISLNKENSAALEQMNSLREKNLSALERIESLESEGLSASNEISRLKNEKTTALASASAAIAKLQERISSLEMGFGRRIERKLLSLLRGER